MSFNTAFHDLVLLEGGYAHDSADSGGETMFGITEAVARRNGYKGDMAALPLETSREIYKAQYWDTLNLDRIAALSRRIAHKLFDTSVNCGVAVAGRILQRTLNAFNREQRDYADIVVDGIVGPATVEALRGYLHRRGMEGESVLMRALNALQGERYVDIAERRQKDERFIYGWFLNRIGG